MDTIFCGMDVLMEPPMAEILMGVVAVMVNICIDSFTVDNLVTVVTVDALMVEVVMVEVVINLPNLFA